MKTTEYTLTKVTNKLPSTYEDVIIFFKYQPMSFVGYYNIEEKDWYFLETRVDNLLEYVLCKEFDLEVEYWIDFPTNF